MEQVSHDWIENYADFEAVLVCQSELHPWDSDGVTRAFQTYGWNDGSTPGNDSTFVHEASGVVVRHDGGLTAIDFGHGDLTDALPDLFEVLHALGWRSAHVYHPIETMDALLVDMGRAIPARLDFDVQAAPGPRAISGFAEGASLLDRAKLLVQSGGMEEVHQTVLNEVRSMDNAPPIALRLAHAISLEDDSDGIGEPNETVVFAPTATAAASAANELYNEEPRLFTLPEYAPASDQDVFNPPQHEAISNEPAEASPAPEAMPPVPTNIQRQLASPATSLEQPSLAPVDPAERETVGQPIQLAEADQIHSYAARFVGSTATVSANPNTVKVGHSVFCFDCPGERLTEAEIRATAEEMGVVNEQLLYIRPGALKQRVRWNVLGEISSEYPGFAEKMATLMEFPSEERVLMAMFLLTVKNSKTNAQMRDVLMAAISSSEMRSLISEVAPAKDLLLGDDRLIGPQIKAATIARLGPLALIPAGQAFMDLPMNQAEPGEDSEETFTVLEVMQSPVPRMLVVQVDELDGPFVVWIVELLRHIAGLYSVTKRYQPVQIQIPSGTRADPIDIERLKQESVQQTLAQVSQLIGSLVQQLNQMVSATAQTGTEV